MELDEIFHTQRHQDGTAQFHDLGITRSCMGRFDLRSLVILSPSAACFEYQFMRGLGGQQLWFILLLPWHVCFLHHRSGMSIPEDPKKLTDQLWQNNLNNTVMLINSIKVYQPNGASLNTEQADTASNQTGAGGYVGRKDGSSAPLTSLTTLSLSWTFSIGLVMVVL